MALNIYCIRRTDLGTRQLCLHMLWFSPSTLVSSHWPKRMHVMCLDNFKLSLCIIESCVIVWIVCLYVALEWTYNLSRVYPTYHWIWAPVPPRYSMENTSKVNGLMDYFNVCSLNEFTQAVSRRCDTQFWNEGPHMETKHSAESPR